jgi:hypothetical protein
MAAFWPKVRVAPGSTLRVNEQRIRKKENSMRKIHHADVVRLAETTDDRLVSMYVPLAHGAENRQGLTRLKNLLRTAEDDLCERGMRRPAAKDVLAPAEKLLEESAQFVSDAPAPALAVFLGPATSDILYVPTECDEHCTIGRHFHLLPLVSWLAEQGSYCLLAVSQNNVRFFSGSRDGLEEQTVPELPASLRDALDYDQREGMYQAHSAGPQLPGKESLVFHGQGGEVDARPRLS